MNRSGSSIPPYLQVILTISLPAFDSLLAFNSDD